MDVDVEEEPAENGDADDGRRLVRVAAAAALKPEAAEPSACCSWSLYIASAVVVVRGSGPEKRYSPRGSNTNSDSRLST